MTLYTGKTYSWDGLPWQPVPILCFSFALVRWNKDDEEREYDDNEFLRVKEQKTNRLLNEKRKREETIMYTNTVEIQNNARERDYSLWMENWNVIRQGKIDGREETKKHETN